MGRPWPKASAFRCVTPSFGMYLIGASMGRRYFKMSSGDCVMFLVRVAKDTVSAMLKPDESSLINADRWPPHPSELPRSWARDLM